MQTNKLILGTHFLWYFVILAKICLKKVGGHQGNLKAESVVAATLLSRMEVTYRTAGFF